MFAAGGNEPANLKQLPPLGSDVVSLGSEEGGFADIDEWLGCETDSGLILDFCPTGRALPPGKFPGEHLL